MDEKYEVKDCWMFFHKWTLWTKWKKDDYSGFENREKVCTNCGIRKKVYRKFTSIQIF